MEGVTTALVAFIFACLIWPHLVKNKPQFWTGLFLVLLVILLDAIGHFKSDSPGLHNVMYVLAAIVQIFAVLLMVLCAGGLTPRDLADEMGTTLDAIRRGGEEKSVLVPLTGEQPKPRQDRPNPAPRRARPAGDEPIPLE